MDVDGTLTDGKIYMGNNGEMCKAFNIKDGYGIHELLPLHEIKTVIITGRNSKIVENRCKELEIDYIFQNIKDKKAKILELSKELECKLEEMAYIGDDIIDLEAMKICGLKGCPNDAVGEIKEVCNFISLKNGGEGAVRDFIEWIIS